MLAYVSKAVMEGKEKALLKVKNKEENNNEK
jgi:hypothetical protein